jgi:hypothetical protein
MSFRRFAETDRRAAADGHATVAPPPRQSGAALAMRARARAARRDAAPPRELIDHADAEDHANRWLVVHETAHEAEPYSAASAGVKAKRPAMIYQVDHDG